MKEQAIGYDVTIWFDPSYSERRKQKLDRILMADTQIKLDQMYVEARAPTENKRYAFNFYTAVLDKLGVEICLFLTVDRKDLSEIPIARVAIGNKQFVENKFYEWRTAVEDTIIEDLRAGN